LSPISFVRAYLRPHLGRLAVLGVVVVAGTLLQLVGPLILRAFVDDAGAKAPIQALMLLVIAYLSTAALQQGISILDARLASDLAMNATNRLRQDLFDRCLRLSLDFHEATPPGAMIQRIDQDAGQLDNALSRMAVILAGNALLVSGVIALILWLDWRVGLVLLGFSLLGAAVRLGLNRQVTRAWSGVRSARADLYGDLEELLGAAEDITALDAAAYAERRLQRTHRGIVSTTLRAILMDGLGGSGATLFELGTTAALWVAILLHGRGHLTLGDVFLVASYARLCLTPLQQIERQVQDLAPAGAAAARTMELLALPDVVSSPDRGVQLPSGPLAVEAEHVHFAYPAGEAVLHDLTFRLPAGARLGLVGRTGAGKTTLARLLVGLHEPGSGRVKIGETSLAQVDALELRQRVAYVSQDVQLVDGTLRDNLTLFGAVEADDETLLHALRVLGLEGWLAAQGQGLDTRLGGAARASAGEEQLIALARVLLRDPGLVVLDEPSSRVDPGTESQLEAAMEKLFEGRTAVVIAHHLETLEHATHILVLDEGRSFEFGKREVLLADPGSHFAQLRRAALAGVAP